MRRTPSGFIASAIALLLFVGALPFTAAAQTAAPPVQHYTMIDLTPAGATNATAVGLSGAQQFGNAGFPSAAAPGTTENHAVLWSGGADGFTDLGAGTATAIADGQQVGVAYKVVGFGAYSTPNAMLWTGTVTLSGPAPAGGALVTLTSNNAAASVPASVLVPAGLTTASFNVQTNTMTTFTTATLTATYGTPQSTQTARLVIAPPPAAVDTVSIQKAEYVASKKQLTVQASSTSQTVTLTVTSTATGEFLGVLTNKGAGSYAGTFTLPASPQNVTVTSDLGGTASLAVKLK